jgi:cysteinyl-tRNA synthetase
MRFTLPAIALFVSVQDIAGFAFPFVGHRRAGGVHLPSRLYSSNDSSKKKDEYDDWYADFNPSDFAWADQPNAAAAGPRSSTARDASGDRSTFGSGRGGGRGDRSSSFGGRSGDRGERSGRGGGRGGGRSFGGSRDTGGGGPHDYTRDPSDGSNVDEARVNRLIEERLTARKTGQFDQADALRDELLNNHGVTVWDKDKVWRSGCSASGSGMKGGSRRVGERSDNARGRGAGAGRTTNFGPNGHDYTLSYDAGPNNSGLSDGEIHRKIAERLQSKMGRDFDAADAIQDVLISAGVYVHDGKKEWRADGRGFGDYESSGAVGRPGRESGSRSDRNRPYQQSPHSEGTEMVEVIQDLLAERIEAKRMRDFDTADAIRDELVQDYNVSINDRNREWSVGGDFGEVKRDSDRDRPYDMAPESLEPKDGELAIINDLVAQRSQAKKTRDFSTADAIRDELMEDYNVAIDDRQKLWSIGGDFGFDMSDRRELAPFMMAPASDRPDNANYIQAQVEAREQARKDRNFAQADDIRDELMDDYNVMVDDKLRQWAVGGMFGNFKPSGGPGDPFVRRGGGDLSKEDEGRIDAMIRQRNDAKRDKDFGKADRIRDQLRDDYAVRVDDRSREWMVVSEDYVMSPVTPMEASLKALINSKISERCVAKLNKDYDIADAIRDELYEEYNVYIDDRVREWKVEGAPSSQWSDNSDDDDDDEWEETVTNGATASEWNDDDDDENDANGTSFDDLDAAMDQVFEATGAATEIEPTNGSSANDSVNLESLTVVELKERLRVAGLPVSGKKAELIQRLVGA